VGGRFDVLWTRRSIAGVTRRAVAALLVVGSTATVLVALPEVAAAAAPAPYVNSAAILPNPERGLFDHNGTCDANAFDPSRIVRPRREKNITLVRCIFYLEGYQNKDLDPAVFTKLNNRAAAAKSLGVKMVLRFAYSKKTSADADLPQALNLNPWIGLGEVVAARS